MATRSDPMWGHSPSCCCCCCPESRLLQVLSSSNSEIQSGWPRLPASPPCGPGPMHHGWRCHSFCHTSSLLLCVLSVSSVGIYLFSQCKHCCNPCMVLCRSHPFSSTNTLNLWILYCEYYNLVIRTYVWRNVMHKELKVESVPNELDERHPNRVQSKSTIQVWGVSDALDSQGL